MNRTMVARLGSVLVLIVIALIAAPAFAHHGRGASYDNGKVEELKGVITEWAWRNPHCALYIDVKGADGKVVNWGFESQSVGSLSKLNMTERSGMNRGKEGITSGPKIHILWVLSMNR